MKQKTTIQSIRGMRDIFGEEAAYFERLLEIIRKQLLAHGYQAFHTPILESTNLFCRSIGEGTDVVEKEMYTFDDNGDSLTMRPEATAGIARALIQNGMMLGNHKLWTVGAMFRRERPQKGRYRQFYQVSVEAFGIAEPEQDAEQIIFINDLCKRLGIRKYVKLHINTLATPEVRDKYRLALVDYLKKHLKELDEDSRRRLNKNPLRILDSKNPQMQAIIEQAPKLKDYLDDVSKQHFQRVLGCLDVVGIDYVIDSRLVRGLDYYNHTVYEWVTDELGAQGTICGGGRYDGLIAHIGGKPTPAVGFGLGVDRTILLMQQTGKLDKKPPLAYFVLMGGIAKREGLSMASKLREAFPERIVLSHLPESSMKNQLKKANQSDAEYAVIIGENELNSRQASVKNLAEGSQQNVAFAELVHFFN